MGSGSSSSRFPPITPSAVTRDRPDPARWFDRTRSALVVSGLHLRGGAARVGAAMPGSEQIMEMPSGRCPDGRGWFVLVAGWPGSGKSTLAAALAAELWGTPSRSLGLGPVVTVDTSGPVDVAKLAGRLARVLAAT